MISIFSFSSASAISMRCRSDLVSEGELKIEVLKSCGEPISKEIVGETEYTDGNRKKIFYIEEWIYERSGGYYILQFEGSKLVSIESVYRK